MLEHLETLHPLEDGGAVGEDTFVGRMHIHRHRINLQQVLHTPDMVEVTVGKEDGIRSKALFLKESDEFLEAFLRGHAGVCQRAGLLAIGPKHHAIGAQRVESKYAGMKHNRLGVIVANLVTFYQLCKIKGRPGCTLE